MAAGGHIPGSGWPGGNAPRISRVYAPPRTLPGFPLAKRVAAKTGRPGGGLRRRWKDPDGVIYEWDYQHGTVEAYDRRGHHVGEFDPADGRQLKPADPTKEVVP